ncbi:MAG: hypothetical protein CM1200mP30_09190 [Pseudomonadota bacterium]|nr:MAG: hypothetical protein CM1200mP30_09190 [Pseudomonadota bacterium]
MEKISFLPLVPFFLVGYHFKVSEIFLLERQSDREEQG